MSKIEKHPQKKRQAGLTTAVLHLISAFLIGLFIQSSMAEEAYLEGLVITVPVVIVGDVQFRIELELIPDKDPITFTINSSIPLENAPLEGASTLIDGVLTIPALQVGDVNYWVNLRESNSDPVQFQLAGLGANQTDIPAQDAEAAALTLFDEKIAEPVIQSRCVACHVAGGLARDTNLLFQRTNVSSTQNNFKSFSEFLTSRDDGKETILSKVTGGNHVGGIQFPPNSIGYNNLDEFLGLLNQSISSAPSNDAQVNFFEGVVLQSNREVLRRASILFSGTAPTQTAIEQAQQGESGLRAALRELMQGDGFHEFLTTGTNDRLLTEGIAFNIIDPNVNSRYPLYTDRYYELSLLAQDDPSYFRIRDDLGRGVDIALAKAPGELVAHVAENDLPYTEILTADYMMMNPLTNSVLGGQAVFENEEDLSEYQPGKTSEYYLQDETHESEFSVDLGTRVLKLGDNRIDYPHAGILNTPAFLSRYPTTATNRNRARARWTFLHFLDIDIEKSSQRPTDPDALADTDNPTLKNPNCTACHATMDPVAGAFQNYDDIGNYKGNGTDSLDGFYKYPESGFTLYQEGDHWYRDMRAPGLFDSLIQNNDTALQELARSIIAEPAFARSTVKFWWPSVFGSKVLNAPAVAEDADYQAQLIAYEAQNASVENLAKKFVEGGFNLKNLFVEMMLTPWFSAASVENTNLTAAHELSGLGREKLLTPERLLRKTQELTGFTWGAAYWGTDTTTLRSNLGDEYRLHYGGIDSLGIIERATEMTPLMSTVTMAHALESACPIVLKEFALPNDHRRLFSGIDQFTSPNSVASADVSVVSSGEGDWSDYSIGSDVSIGDKEISVLFTNPWCDWDGQQCQEQRTLFLDHIEVLTPGASAYERIEGNSNLTTLSEGCYPAGPDGDDVVFFNNCSVSFTQPLTTAGRIEVRFSLSGAIGDNVYPTASLSVVDLGDPYLSKSDSANRIRNKLVELHKTLLGKSYSPDSEEINAAYNIFVASWLERQQLQVNRSLFREGETCNWYSDINFLEGLDFPGDPFRFNSQGNYWEWKWDEVSTFLNAFANDPAYVKQSWVAVMAYLLTHYDYLYE